jgi:hypothetical protein
VDKPVEHLFDNPSLSIPTSEVSRGVAKPVPRAAERMMLTLSGEDMCGGLSVHPFIAGDTGSEPSPQS